MKRTNRLRYNSNRRPRRKNRISRHKKMPVVLKTTLLGLCLGAIAGILLCFIQDSDHITSTLRSFFIDINQIHIIKLDVFFECIIRYGKTILMLWFLAFLPPGSIISIIIIFTKGMGIGFTSSLFIKEFGVQGIWYICTLYLPQNLILIPTYIFACYSSISFCLLQINRNKNLTETTDSNTIVSFFSISTLFTPLFFDKESVFKYLKTLLIGFCCITIVSLIETYVIPQLIHTLQI